MDIQTLQAVIDELEMHQRHIELEAKDCIAIVKEMLAVEDNHRDQ